MPHFSRLQLTANSSRVTNHIQQNACLRRLLVSIIAIGAIAGSVRADVIEMKDGRRFEGEVMHRDEKLVRIDTIVATIRTVLTLKMNEVAEVKESPLPAGFFEPPPAPKREARPKDEVSEEGLYLEVPIMGQFGKSVQIEGIRATLAYARRNHIRDIVFYIDGDGLNDFDEAHAIFSLLETNHAGLRFHGVIKRAVGESLAVAFQCDTLAILPGAQVGGAGMSLKDAGAKLTVSEAVYRRQFAFDLCRKLDARGRRGPIAAAMVDPAEELAAWKNAEGQIELGARPPAGIGSDKVVFQTLSGSPLVLSDAQCVALGVPMLSGGVPALGAVIGVSPWMLESNYGERVMKQAVEIQMRLDASKQAKFDNEVKTNVRRRGVADSALQNGIKRAAEWDPTKASYETYSSRYSWGWGGRGDGGSHDTNYMTTDAQSRWKRRTDNTMGYIKQAGDAAVTLRQLDEQAVKLGLDPTYKPGELDLIIQDLEARYQSLQADRDKKYHE